MTNPLEHIRKGRRYTIDGEHLSLKQIAKKYGLSYTALANRIRRHPEKLLKDLVHPANSKYREGTELYTYDGKTLSCSEWAKICKVTIVTMANRFRNRSVQDAVEDRPLGVKFGDYTKSIPTIDADLELKRRIKAYRKKGWDDSEIYYKIVNGDFQLGAV